MPCRHTISVFVIFFSSTSWTIPFFFMSMLMKTLSPEEYILATINLYLDIVNLFLYILRALEAVRRQ
uniref:Uncharacterized protein n=1 Tax=Timema monikensis TaxID=170555 RepID=A0A7R9EIX1_9NEOP|nr:unnamed protein product [Timema monikensis]